MVRAIDDDFESLAQFFKDYSLDHVARESAFIASVKTGHKLYLSLLYLWAQCEDLAAKGKLCLCGTYINADELMHLKECISDIGGGFFCCFHGVYKPGHMSLRSSIENFLRFAAGRFDSRAVRTTSVFELFDIAQATPPFDGRNVKYLRELRGAYTELCKYSHSSTMTHMAGVHALSHYPSFDGAAFAEWTKLAKLIGKAITCTLVFSGPDIFFKGHFQTREIIELLLPAHERRLLLERK